MDTINRDIKINELKRVLENRIKLLVHNNKEINKSVDKNYLLQDIAEEYKSFFSIYLQECKALSKLSDYIDAIALDNKTDKKMISDLKKEQERIFKEIKKIETKLKIIK